MALLYGGVRHDKLALADMPADGDQQPIGKVKRDVRGLQPQHAVDGTAGRAGALGNERHGLSLVSVVGPDGPVEDSADGCGYDPGLSVGHSS